MGQDPNAVMEKHMMAADELLGRGQFDEVFDHLRQERNRCIRGGDTDGARGFDQADALLRAAILDEGLEGETASN